MTPQAGKSKTGSSACRRCDPAARPAGAVGTTHAVYEVLNELHGLAVWARERPDTS